MQRRPPGGAHGPGAHKSGRRRTKAGPGLRALRPPRRWAGCRGAESQDTNCLHPGTPRAFCWGHKQQGTSKVSISSSRNVHNPSPNSAFCYGLGGIPRNSLKFPQIPPDSMGWALPCLYLLDSLRSLPSLVLSVSFLKGSGGPYSSLGDKAEVLGETLGKCSC